MMAELARLDPSRVGKKSTARLLPARAEDLLDPDQMERLRSLLERFGRR